MKNIALILFAFFTACSSDRELKNHDLLVPPFIQDENPEIHDIYKGVEKK
jgi:hypothetical protein